MIPVPEALEIIRSQCVPLPVEPVDLDQCWHRVLREEIHATEDLPAFDRAAMDGYAIRRDDPGEELSVVGEIQAGGTWAGAIEKGQALRIFTGAALPPGGLRVVMQEDVELQGGRIKLRRRSAELNIRFRGEDAPRGSRLLSQGIQLGGGEMAVLASLGQIRPRVTRALRVSHFVMGDELVPPGAIPQAGQIRNSNSSLLQGLLRDMDLAPRQGWLRDDVEAALQQLQSQAVDQADLLLISGGTSVGKMDFTRPLLERLGFQIHISKVRVRPGKPLLFGASGSRVAFGLPGNPLSHFVCFHLFVGEAIRCLQGLPRRHGLPAAFLEGGLPGCLNERETYAPARISTRGGMLHLTPLAWRSSGDVVSLIDVNALLLIPAGTPDLAAGAAVSYLPVTH